MAHREIWLRDIGVPKMELMIRLENAAVCEF